MCARNDKNWTTTSDPRCFPRWRAPRGPSVPVQRSSPLNIKQSRRGSGSIKRFRQEVFSRGCRLIRTDVRWTISKWVNSREQRWVNSCERQGKAAGLWGKAGQRSVARSALVEAVEQLTRALDQAGALPVRPRRAGSRGPTGATKIARHFV